jgi:hypothetical protein
MSILCGNLPEYSSADSILTHEIGILSAVERILPCAPYDIALQNEAFFRHKITSLPINA